MNGFLYLAIYSIIIVFVTEIMHSKTGCSKGEERTWISRFSGFNIVTLQVAYR